MIRFAQYHGKSAISRGIKFLTRSEISHSAIEFTAPFVHSNGQRIHVGNVIEAWDTGVRLVSSLSSQHDRGTKVDLYEYWEPLTPVQFQALASFLCDQLGKPYSWTDVFRFITKRPGQFAGLPPVEYKRWFCSCLVYAATLRCSRGLFRHTEAWEVPPGMVHRSPLVRYCETVTTGTKLK